MSQIIATTLSNGSVSVPTATVVNGSAKAWVNFNGTGTIAARDSFNVASLTDNGTGSYTVSFSNSMASPNYSFLPHAGDSGDSGIARHASSLATSVTLSSLNSAQTAVEDANFVFATIHGDLA